MTPRLISSLLLTACLGVAVVVNWPAASMAGPGSPVEMVHAWWAEPVNLNPLVAAEGFAYTFNMLVYDGLVELDDNNVPIPALAQRWNVSPDGRRYTFFLRKDVTWHDGRPFTADDVVFSIYAHLHPRTGSNYFRAFEPLEGFEQLTNRTNPAAPGSLPSPPVVALDKHTVVFRLRYPYAPFLKILQTYRGAIAPKHLLEGANISEAELNRRPIGTGRYKFVEWRRGDRIVFEANDRYYRGRPKVDRVVVRIIPDRTVGIEELKKGTAHFVYNATFEHRAELERTPGLTNILKPATNWVGLTPNLRNELFQDRKVRQAMMHGIDRVALVKAVYRGYATIATGPIAPAHGDWVFNKTIKPYPHDLNRARALLREAGWVAGSDGILQRGGKRFSFSIVAEKTQDIENVVVFAQEQLRRLGMDVRVELVDRAASVDRVRRGDFEVAYGHPSGNPDPDPETTNYFHSKGPSNTQGYANPQVDQLLERGRQLIKQEERAKVYADLQQVFHDDVPWVWLVWIPWMHSWSANFTGFTAGPAVPVGNYYSLHLVRRK